MNQPTNQPPSASFLRRAYRNQLFDHTGLLVGECGLDAKEVAIFPVRYALDESPEKGSAQGPNPLPSHWHGKQPELQTRSYTLRQLRDGWLYVWNSTDNTLDEYQVQGNHFTRHLWTSAELNQDVRNNPTTCEPYLLYPRTCRLRIAYSPVQWTWRLCELMGTPEGQQSPWLRSVDLPAYCNSGELEHGAMLIELGKRVADIFEHGASAPSFTSTLLPTTASEPGEPCKPAFEECLVRGLVPDQNTALFVALDDPLALLDDLNMNLAGRLLEQNQFQAAHEHELHSAFAVQRLCGFDADALMPKTLKDPLQRQDYTDDLYGLLAVSDEIEAAKDLVQPEVQGLAALAGEKMRQQARARFQAKWGHLPAPDTWQAVEDEWQAKRPWRADVRFDEMRQYVSQTTRQAEQLQAHCQRSERDLLTWVNRLGTRAEALYHDTGNAEHASQLLETARALYTNLAIGEAGQCWLHEQATAPTTLMGLALYNFDPDVAALIKQVSYNFSTTGMLDDQGRQGDGSTPGLDLKNSGDIASIATRVQEIKGVLDIDAVTESRLYQGMSNVAKQALHTLIDVANQQAADAWHSLSLFLLPAMKGQTALTLAATQVLISSEVATHTHLLFNPEYPDEFKTWLRHTWALNNKIDGARQVLQRPGHPRDHRATRIALQQLEAQRQAHLLDKPNRITARASGDTTRLNANRQTIQGWLSDLGRSEVRAQAQLKQTDGGRYHARISAWANQNLGQALPVLVLGLNLWNFHNTAEQAQKDGQYSADEWRKLGASAAYTANALMTLWVVPTWDRAGKMWAPLGQKTAQLADAGYWAWKGAIATATKAGEDAIAATAQEFATLSKRLIVQTVSWALLGAVAAGLEAWQVSIDRDNATSKDEENALWWKHKIVIGMAGTAAVQTIGTFWGYWYSFAWVMAKSITILIAVLGIVYLLSSVLANRYKREGLRLWLHRCTWGREPNPAWSGDEGHAAQMSALMETLQRPSVLGRAVSMTVRGTPRAQGFWLQLQLPNSLAGHETRLQPALIDDHYFIDDRLHPVPAHFYEQFLNGSWINPSQLGQLPKEPGTTLSPADYTYAATDQQRLWQVWIETALPSPTLELEVSYPPDMIQRRDGRGYMFRVALTTSTNEADRKNDAFSGELKDDVLLTRRNTQWVSLIVPTYP